MEKHTYSESYGLQSSGYIYVDPPPCDACEHKKKCGDEKLACEQFMFYADCKKFSDKVNHPRKDIYELIFKD